MSHTHCALAHTHIHSLLRDTSIACLVYVVSFPGCVMTLYQLQRYSSANGVSWLIELRQSGSVLNYPPCWRRNSKETHGNPVRIFDILRRYPTFTSCGVILPQGHIKFAFRLAFQWYVYSWRLYCLWRYCEIVCICIVNCGKDIKRDHYTGTF